MTNQRIETMIEESEKMLCRIKKNPQLKTVYKDVNFRRIIEDGKAELFSREIPFKELMPGEQELVEAIFS